MIGDSQPSKATGKVDFKGSLLPLRYPTRLGVEGKPATQGDRAQGI